MFRFPNYNSPLGFSSYASTQHHMRSMTTALKSFTKYLIKKSNPNLINSVRFYFTIEETVCNGLENSSKLGPNL